VVLRSDLDDLEMRTFLPLPGLETNFSVTQCVTELVCLSVVR